MAEENTRDNQVAIEIKTIDYFTRTKNEIIKAIQLLEKPFFDQTEYIDPIKYIADKLENMKFINNNKLRQEGISKYIVVDRFLLETKEIFNFNLPDDCEQDKENKQSSDAEGNIDYEVL